MIPVISYIRVSRVGGREDTFISPDLQRQACEREAEKSGLTIVATYEELDASGGDNTRPMWNEAIERIERGEAKGLLVWNLSRFSRSLVDAITAIERIEAAGGAVYSASGEAGDNSPTGKLTRNIFLALGQMERERARDGFAAAQVAAIERGIFIGSRIPTGYLRDPETRRLVPDPVWAPIIAEMFEHRAAGWSWGKITEWWISVGGSPSSSRQAVMNRIKNVSYLGWSRHGEKLNKHAHQPLVSQRLFDSANERRYAIYKHTGRASEETLYGGFVKCDGCGCNLSVTTNGRGQISYACKTFACTARAGANAADLDAEVTLRIMSFLNKPKPVDWQGAWHTTRATWESGESSPQERESVSKALADAEYDRKLFISNKELRRLMSAEEYATELESMNQTIQELTDLSAILKQESKPAAIEDFEAVWETWTRESKREWLDSFIETIIVKTAHKRPIPVRERMAVQTKMGHHWITSDGNWSTEAFGDVVPESKLIAPIAQF